MTCLRTLVCKHVKSKNKLKPWESIIVSENLSWSDFLKINNYLYDLVGVKPVMTISRNYPFSETYTHILEFLRLTFFLLS